MFTKLVNMEELDKFHAHDEKERVWGVPHRDKAQLYVTRFCGPQKKDRRCIQITINSEYIMLSRNQALVVADAIKGALKDPWYEDQTLTKEQAESLPSGKQQFSWNQENLYPYGAKCTNGVS